MSTVVLPQPSSSSGRGAPSRVLVAGAAMAVLDILYAWLNWVVVQKVITTQQLFQSISAGVLGRDAARAGGTGSAALGAVLHLVIALIWAFIFYAAVRTIPALRRMVSTTSGAIVAGLLFGVVVYLGMNYVVVPLSNTGRGFPKITTQFFVNLVQHMVMVGLPIALIIRDGRAR